MHASREMGSIKSFIAPKVITEQKREEEVQVLKYEVFICYKQKTAKDYAIHLWEGLKDHQITAFLDIKDIPKTFKEGTNNWRSCRNQAIIDCRIFLMIVTRGFERSPEIQKEIDLAIKEKRDLMCLRRRILPADIPIDLLMKKHINLEDYQQTPFDTPEELLRSVLDNLIEPKQRMEHPPSIKQPVVEEKRRFPLTYFNITQAVQNNPMVKRKLPNVGFNIRNWGDSPIRAKVKARVFLGGKDLGLIKGSHRGGKYMGYYDGKVLWNLNPYTIFFGHFNVPKICAETEQTLRIEVSVNLIGIDGQKYKLLPVSWTFMRKKNDWFLEPTGDL